MTSLGEWGRSLLSREKPPGAWWALWVGRGSGEIPVCPICKVIVDRTVDIHHLIVNGKPHVTRSEVINWMQSSLDTKASPEMSCREIVDLVMVEVRMKRIASRVFQG